MQSNPGITRGRLTKRLSVLIADIEYHLKKLRKANIVEVAGSAKGAHWKVIFKLQNILLMINGETFREMALSFQHTEQNPHFDRIGFKIIGKRMFATYLEANNTANVFLTPAEQKLFCQMDKKNIYPVPNKWGDKGATTFELDHVAKELVLEALLSAYNEILKPKAKK